MRRLLLAAGAVAILVAISGCDAADPRVTPAPTPSATPVFAPDEEALAAAEAAYAAYQAEVDRALATYDTSGLDAVATGSALEGALSSIEQLRGAGKRQTGLSTIDTVTLAQVAESDLQAYACLDVSGVEIVDANGSPTLAPGRDTRFPTLVTFDFSDSNQLLVAEEQAWDGNDFCA